MKITNKKTRLRKRLSIHHLDSFLYMLHTSRSGYKKLIAAGSSLAIYCIIILLFGNQLQISSNYFIIIPMISLSFLFGLKGGIIAGISALPLNLLMFRLLGHPDYSPESKLIAEVTGITIGTILGYLSDYFYEIEIEIERRREAEEKLLNMVQEKEILIQEIHHRVKNNLNIVKSLIQLQINRSKNDEFIAEADKLIQRIYSISRVHEQLYKANNAATPALDEYIPSLVNDILSGLDEGRLQVTYNVKIPNTEISLEQATSLGLILNEVLTNAIKYSLSLVESPKLDVIIRRKSEIAVIELINNAPTFIPGPDDQSGLGLKLINTLCEQLNAKYEYIPSKGTTFRLKLPILKSVSQI